MDVKQTPYQAIRNSAPGKFVRQHPVLSGVAAVGGGIVVAGGAAQSQVFANVAEYGIGPALGAGMAVLGGTMVHDAFVNDLAEHKGRAAAKITSGTLMTL